MDAAKVLQKARGTKTFPLSVEGGVKKGKEGEKKKSMIDGVQSKSKWVVRVVEGVSPCIFLVFPVAYKGLRP